MSIHDDVLKKYMLEEYSNKIKTLTPIKITEILKDLKRMMLLY